MEKINTRNISEICPHCDSKSLALKHKLKQTKEFNIVCDVHPLCEGHILIIPKEHISCIGAYSESLFKEFESLYSDVSDFMNKTYGPFAVFEHGIIGQTVFHSHVHFLPFQGSFIDVIPEGEDKLEKISKLEEIKEYYKKLGKYLFISINNDMRMVDLVLGSSRFFRDRFAVALDNPQRGNWKEMEKNYLLMQAAEKEIKNLTSKWNNYFLGSNLKTEK